MIWNPFRWTNPRHKKGNKSKRTHTKGKRKHPNRRSAPSFSHTTAEERQAIFALRREGLSVHAIAKTLGRSSRTIYQVLTSRGSRPLPPRGRVPQGGSSGEGQRPGRRRKRRGAGGTLDGPGMSRRLEQQLEAIVTEGAREVFRDDSEFAQQVIVAKLGLKLPKKSVDDFVLEELKENPSLRKEWAEEHLKQMKYRGRTELEIVNEGLEMFFTFLDRCGRSTNWPDAVVAMAKSGELHRTLQAVVEGIQAAKKPSPQSAQSAQAAQVAPSDSSQLDPQIAPAHGEAALKRLPRQEGLAVWKKALETLPPPSIPPTPDRRPPEMTPGDTRATGSAGAGTS